MREDQATDQEKPRKQAVRADARESRPECFKKSVGGRGSSHAEALRLQGLGAWEGLKVFQKGAGLGV